jgi:hypothetical protein
MGFSRFSAPQRFGGARAERQATVELGEQEMDMAAKAWESMR